MSIVTIRYLLSLGNIFFSLILGALAMILCWYFFDGLTNSLFEYAGWIRERIINLFWGRMKVGIRIFISDKQLVYMGFVLFSRMVVGLLIALVFWLLKRPASIDEPLLEASDDAAAAAPSNMDVALDIEQGRPQG